MRALADEQATGGFDALALHFDDFFDQAKGVNDHTIPENAHLSRTQNPGRNEMKDELFVTDFDRMPGIVATLETRDHLGIFRKHIYDFAFAFVAPLSAYQNSGCHGR